MAGKVMLNPWVYGRGRGRNPRKARLWPIYQVGGSASRTFATKRAARTWKRRYGGRIEEMRSMMGPHRETFNPRRGRRVPGMLRAPKWGLYRAGGRKRRYNRHPLLSRRARLAGFMGTGGPYPISKRDAKGLMRHAYGLRPFLAPETMRYGSPRYRGSRANPRRLPRRARR